MSTGPAATAASGPAEPPCREPGQVVSADYLRRGRLRYEAEGREITRRNGPHFNNRPLYCSPSSEGAVLAGDRPLVRLLARPYVLGHWAAVMVRGDAARWLHDFREIEMRYRCGRVEWRCGDPDFPGLAVTLIAVPLASGAGFALRMKVTGAGSGGRLMWMFGGAKPEEDPKWTWDPVMRGNPDICRAGDPRRPMLAQGLMPEWSAGNVATAGEKGFRLAAAQEASRVATGRVTHGDLSVGSATTEPSELGRGIAGGGPVVSGAMQLAEGAEVLWAVEEGNVCREPGVGWSEAVARLAEVECARAATPDPRLDAALAAVCHAIDGNCERETSIYLHGAMAFCIRFIGWRVIGGATALGWHDRVTRNAQHFFRLQILNDPVRDRPRPDESKLLCHESLASRFYGKGVIERQSFLMYDVQSQFFDQTVRDWRWTADPVLEAGLRPALELHLEWMRECFDPDDDGLYESYINTLPTDSVWYSGGGSAEESAYAYFGHQAAADLARRAGDAVTEARHRARAAKIQRAMRDVLWVKERGHFGLFREQGGLRRVHTDAWVYGAFLPIDAGLTDAEEALQSLYFTEWALERIRLPFGGELCQPSNWVPWKWSVRDMFGGDLAALALAYFQTGLGDEGYELLRGVMHESAYASVVPGAFSHIGAGTDFGDNTHMFARAVVEGLFGFAPDYPNGRVSVRPAFPAVWEKASIETKDFSLSYGRDGGTECYRLMLTRVAAVELVVPVRAERVLAATVNGAPVPWEPAPGFGCTLVAVRAPSGAAFELKISVEGRTGHSHPIALEGRAGEGVALEMAWGQAGELRDFHSVLEGAECRGGRVTARLATRPGYHLVLVRCQTGELTRWQVCKLQVTDPAAEAERRKRTPGTAAAGADWVQVNLAAHFNGDVREIFRQRYLSPRPDTCSVRLGVDGYSAWTFPHWNLSPPEIGLDRVPALTDGQGRLATPQGARFHLPAPGRNIVFTSRWDNWPTAVQVEVGREAEVVWALVCGTTFPMQTRIANAELRFAYADGVVERLELVPPLNYWMLCPWGGEDYSYEHDAWCLPPEPPPMAQLGANCRAMVLSWRLRAGVELRTVTLEALSEEVVVGLMGLSLERRPA